MPLPISAQLGAIPFCTFFAIYSLFYYLLLPHHKTSFLSTLSTPLALRARAACTAIEITAGYPPAIHLDN